MSLSASPDRFDIAKGDEIAWTILLENDGDGTAYGVIVNVTLDPGLQLVEIDSPKKALDWSYASLAPGQTEQIILKARVVETPGAATPAPFKPVGALVPARRSDQLSKLGARTALRKQPDQPRSLAVGETVGFEISADLPRGAHGLWINDTIPQGLIYNKSSLSVQGPGLQRELVSRKFRWLPADLLVLWRRRSRSDDRDRLQLPAGKRAREPGWRDPGEGRRPP